MGVLSVMRELDDVASELGRDDAVAIISCNNCVRGCGSGGEMKLAEIEAGLRERGVRVEEAMLHTKLCARAFIEHRPPPPAVQAVAWFGCTGSQAGFSALFPDLRVVPGIDSLGMMMNSKKAGRLKLVFPFPGHEDKRGREYQVGNTRVCFDDTILGVAS